MYDGLIRKPFKWKEIQKRGVLMKSIFEVLVLTCVGSASILTMSIVILGKQEVGTPDLFVALTGVSAIGLFGSIVAAVLERRKSLKRTLRSFFRRSMVLLVNLLIAVAAIYYGRVVAAVCVPVLLAAILFLSKWLAGKKYKSVNARKTPE